MSYTYNVTKTLKRSHVALSPNVTSNSSWIWSFLTSQVFEERQKRLLSEVEAERSDGDSRAQRLRQELRRLEQDWHCGNGGVFFFQRCCFSFKENSSTHLQKPKAKPCPCIFNTVNTATTKKHRPIWNRLKMAGCRRSQLQCSY